MRAVRQPIRVPVRGRSQRWDEPRARRSARGLRLVSWASLPEKHLSRGPGGPRLGGRLSGYPPGVLPAGGHTSPALGAAEGRDARDEEGGHHLSWSSMDMMRASDLLDRRGAYALAAVGVNADVPGQTTYAAHVSGPCSPVPIASVRDAQGLFGRPGPIGCVLSRCSSNPCGAPVVAVMSRGHVPTTRLPPRGSSMRGGHEDVATSARSTRFGAHRRCLLESRVPWTWPLPPAAPLPPARRSRRRTRVTALPPASPRSRTAATRPGSRGPSGTAHRP